MKAGIKDSKMKGQSLVSIFSAVLLLAVIGCRGSAPEATKQVLKKPIPLLAAETAPLAPGQPLPDIVLKRPDNTPFNLNRSVRKKPTALIYYRGGWCPYCSRHLAELQEIEPDLIKLGFQIIAVSPDKPELLPTTANQHGLDYQLLSDSSMQSAHKLGIAFKLDQPTVDKYKSSYKIDIERDSGETHHLLPVPAVFIIDTKGIIRFTYADPDYKVRIKPQELMNAARKSLQ